MFDFTDPTVISAVAILITYFLLQQRKKQQYKQQQKGMNDLLLPAVVGVAVYFALTQMDMSGATCYNPKKDLIRRKFVDQDVIIALADF